MRRYSFYLLIALLAFGIGSFVVFNYYPKKIEQFFDSKQREEQAINIVKDSSLEKNIPTDEQFDEWKMNSFKPTLKKWLKNQKLENYVALDRDDEWASSGEHGASVELIDVNSDGINELALKTACATVGNCEFWLFKKTKSSYEIILSTDMVQRFKLRKNKSHGYYDLETSAHGSSTSGEIVIYKFNGNEYEIDKCFDYEYKLAKKKNGESLYTKNGQIVVKDKPTLTPISCRER